MLQEGEDPALAQPVTENLNAVLQLLEYSAVRWARLGEGGVKRWSRLRDVCLPAKRQVAELFMDAAHQAHWSSVHCRLPIMPLSLPAPQIEELSLTGNQRRSDMLRRRLRFKAGDSLTNSTWLEGSMGGGAKGRGAGSSASSAASAAGAEIIDCRSECAFFAAVCIEADCCSRLNMYIARAGGHPNAVQFIRRTAPLCIPPPLAGGCRNGELLVTLKPMEVRTFNLLYKPY